MSGSVREEDKIFCVFEYDNGSDGKEYKLYIPAKKDSKSNMMINHCEKQSEFQFDDVDYGDLIEKIK